MRKLMAPIFICLLASATLKAQTVNDVPLKNLDVDYMQIIGRSEMSGGIAYIEIDFGKENKDLKSLVLKDANGQYIRFKSMIDALNFFTKNGFEFVQAYAYHSDGEKYNAQHFLLRKKK